MVKALKSELSHKTAEIHASHNKRSPVMVVSSIRVLLLGCFLLVFGTMGFYSIPGLLKTINTHRNDDDEVDEADLMYITIVNSFYCTTMTLTTIGFGDVCPGELTLYGRVFLIVYSIVSLGFFTGPLMDVTTAWIHHVPGGLPALASITFSFGMGLFMHLEGLSHSEAAYASVVAGTTIGYGDITPRTESGKVGVALYSLLVVNVVGALLEPAREFLEGLCHVVDYSAVTTGNTNTSTSTISSKKSETVRKDDSSNNEKKPVAEKSKNE